MPRVQWDSDGTRIFETGIDRGMLYLPSAAGVAWNGLMSVSESPTGGEAREYYIDGEKYLNLAAIEEYSATVQAFSSPREFAPCAGLMYIQPGLYASDQPLRQFGFSYRTLVGDDLQGTDAGYKIHLVYNATAKISDFVNQTAGDNPGVSPYSWEISAIPEVIPLHAPTSHFVVDSRKISSTLLRRLEDILYGTDSDDPRLITVSELLSLLATEFSYAEGGIALGKMSAVGSGGPSGFVFFSGGPAMKKMVISGAGEGGTEATGAISMKKMQAHGSGEGEVSLVSGEITMKKLEISGTSPGGDIRFGVFQATSAYGATTWADAYAHWQQMGGRPYKVTRVYLGGAAGSVPLGANDTAMINAGVRMCITLRPAWNPPTQADLDSMVTYLNALKTAGADVIVTLHHEPYYAGMTAAQFKTMWAFYQEDIRAIYPLWLGWSGSGPEADMANGWYPPGGTFDGIGQDAYLSTIGDTLDHSEAGADYYEVGWGIWEFNVSTDPVRGSTQAETETWFQELVDRMVARRTAGKKPGDVIFFCGLGQSNGIVNFLGWQGSENAGFEGPSQGDWVAAGNCTIAPSSANPHSGTGNLAMTSTLANGNMGAGSCLAADILTKGLACSPGNDVWVFGHSKSRGTNRLVKARAEFYNSTPALISALSGAGNTEITDDHIYTESAVTAPSGTVRVRANMQVLNAALDEVHDIDDVFIAIIPSSPHCQPIQFGWDYRLNLIHGMEDQMSLGGLFGGARLKKMRVSGAGEVTTGQVFTNSFNGITPSGTVLTQGSGGNTGGISGQYFDSITGSLQSSDAYSHSGDLSLRADSSGTAKHVNWTSSVFGVVNGPLYWRGYIRSDGVSWPSVTSGLVTFRSASAPVGVLNLVSGGMVRMYDAASQALWTSSALATGQWHRVEVMITGGTTGSDGQFQCKIFSGANLETNTPSQDSGLLTGRNAGTSGYACHQRMGITTSGVTASYMLDDVAGSADGWIGPLEGGGEGSEKLIPAAGKAWFGAYPAAGNSDPPGFEAANMADRMLGVWQRYYAIDNPWPYSDDQTYVSQGRHLVVCWSTRLAAGGYANWEDVTAGDYDSVMTDTANRIASWGQPVFVGLNNEFDGATVQANAGAGHGGADYVPYFRHTVNLMRPIAPNIIWCWVPSGNNRNAATAAMYPGDDYVDWIGFDLYDSTLSKGSPSATYSPFRTWIDQQSFGSGKPLGIFETGIQNSQNESAKATWINLVPACMVDLDIRMWMWFNSSGGLGDTTITPGSASAAALANIGANSVFNPS